MKDPKRIFPRLTWTALDVGGPCVETFGMNICEDAPAIAQGRELQEAALAPIFCFFMPFGMNLARFLRMVCQLIVTLI